jgi:excisionase family DNA binding protein
MTAPTMESVPKLALGAADAAVALGVSERHLTGLAVDGKVPSLMVGQRRVFPVNVLNEWMRQHCAKWLVAEGQEGGS